MRAGAPRAITAVMNARSEPAPPAAAQNAPTSTGFSRTALWIAALAFPVILLFLSLPTQDSGWLQGDERIFIANNFDVTGDAGEASPWPRWGAILTHVHEDLYQPLPILSYAVEWWLWGERRVFFIRMTDVLLHAFNAILIWAVLYRLLERFAPGDQRSKQIISYGFAALWAFHPTLVAAYAADMGRTHILSATFALLALLAQMKSLSSNTARPRWGWFGVAFLCLFLAMLCKPIVGWFLIFITLECAWIGAHSMLKSPRVYLVAAVCGLFAYLTYVTTRASGILEDSQLALFGDPLSRSLTAAFIYFRNIVIPTGLATWYPPDIHVSWSYSRTLIGAAIVGLSLIVLVWSVARRRPLVVLGVIWFWAILLPVIGVVGARAAAAQDRYLYLPLAGLLILTAGFLQRWAGDRISTAKVGTAICLIAALACAAIDRNLIADDRNMLARAEQALALDPQDPRLLEFSAMAAAHARSYGDRHGKMDRESEFARLWNHKLHEAAAQSENAPQYFRDAGDRAAFHRRISWQLALAGEAADSLKQAERARDFQPDAPFTWTRLAQGYRANQRWDEARDAYARLAAILPPNPEFNAQRLTEYGDLLLYQFNDLEGAKAKFEAALATGVHLPQAGVGLARCEVLIGNGAAGYEIASQVLKVQPDNVDAAVVIAMYHLRSHQNEQANPMYRQILRAIPNHYEALRGFHETCLQLNKPRDAALAWQDAVRAAPDRPEFRGFFVWAAACAGEEVGRTAAEKMVAAQPGDRFGCLALMLTALKAGRVEEALDWVDRATGQPLPEAKEFERAEATLRIMQARNELPPAATLVRVTLRLGMGLIDPAREALQEASALSADAALAPLVERVRSRLPIEK